MNDQPKTFGSIASKAMTDAAASFEPSTKENSTSIGSPEIEHRRHFLQTFRRWAMLFKRKDGDVEADKWLIAEYYKSLGHLSEQGLDRLTDVLKETCVFFPTIKECLDITRPGKWEFSHPFYSIPNRRPAPSLSAPARQIEYQGDD